MNLRRFAFLVLVGALVIGYLGSLPGAAKASPQPAELYSASEVIQLVNQLRRVNGLQPYRVSSALTAAAQAHSEYQAATGNASHTGKGGSRPHDRAVAYGYGGGAAVSVSENIYSGSNASAAQAVGWWQGDGLHLGTMLSSSYRDAGAGVAQADGVTYFTLVVGYVSGDQGQPGSPGGSGGSPTNPPAGTPGSQPAPAGTAVTFLVPIQVATPRPDGSLVHEVQWGQFLLNIAETYEVELPYLLVLNGLTASTVIYPGDKLLIHPADPTATVQPSPTTADTATATRTEGSPTQTPASSTSTPERQAAIAVANADAGSSAPGAVAASAGDQEDTANAPAGQSAGESSTGSRGGLDPMLLVIGVLVVGGTVLMLFGSAVSRRS